MGQQTVPGAWCILAQTTLSPVEIKSQRPLPQHVSISAVHRQQKQTWRSQVWKIIGLYMISTKTQHREVSHSCFSW